MTAGDLIKFCYAAYGAAEPAGRHDYLGARWVMDRTWYDCVRAAVCTPEQELERARAHLQMMIDVNAPPPVRCPACHAGPFASLGELSEHAVMMADPGNREPDTRDWMLGVRIEVRDGGGAPHLETVDRAAL